MSSSKKPKWFNMDLHISVIADLKDLLHERWDITDWCLSGHSWVFSRKQEYPDVINPKTWIHLNETMIAQFQEKYDDFLKGFDGFICGHPNGFVMLFEKYNKPILMVNTCRYDLPFCISKNRDMLEKYHACLHRLQDRGLLIAVSNSRADQFYTRIGTGGIQTKVVPSLCAYTKMRYAPTRPTFLLHSDTRVHGMRRHHLITFKSELGHPYSWTDIGSFRGIIYWPYEVSTMSMFEHYAAGMPMFFPSKTMTTHDSLPLQSISAYWGQPSSMPAPLAASSLADLNTWIDLADWNTLFAASPNVYMYDSWEHLYHLIETFVWQLEDREPYRQGIIDAWDRILASQYEN